MPNLFVDSLDYDSISGWFSRTSKTDNNYLKASLPRFVATHEWAREAIGPNPVRILDIGAHWLQNAFIYANDGHKLVCADTPHTFRNPHLQKHAERMGADLVEYQRLDKAQNIRDLPEDSFDIVLFCEILEHLAFNPITMWKAIYRALKPGGAILLTTPNAFFGPSLIAAYDEMAMGRGLGIPLGRIFDTGTLGHHWKEYSAPELRRYFEFLSSDFEIRRLDIVSVTADPFETPEALPFKLPADIDPRGDNIFAEIRIAEKRAGITVNPPWEPR